jgi:hypothetical protein
VSHIRPEDRTFKTRRAACRRGHHHYGESQNVGAGILRRVCDTCGEVTIDLTDVDGVTAPAVRKTFKIKSLSADDT